MKFTLVILLAMVGTGFGQTTTIQPNTGTVNGHDLSAPNFSQRCYMTCTSKVAAKTAVEIPCPTSGSGKVSAVPFESEVEPVDVPAIQELYAGPKNCGAKTSPGEETGWVDGMLCSQKPPLEWTCEDKENRALLTSVNGKRHSCHLIQEGK